MRFFWGGHFEFFFASYQWKTQPIYMRYHFFLHYGWFFQNLRKEAVRTFMHTTVHWRICMIQLASFLWVFKFKTQIINCINKTILWQGPFLVNDTIKESQTLPNFCSFWNGRTHLPTAGLWQKIALLHLRCLHHFLLICLIFNRNLSRFFDCLAHLNLSATLATEQIWPLSYLPISYQSLAECH